MYRSNYDPVRYNGTEKDEEPSAKTERTQNQGNQNKGNQREGNQKEGDEKLEKFSFSDLPRLDYGSGEERDQGGGGGGGGGGDELSRDQMALSLRELGAATR